MDSKIASVANGAGTNIKEVSASVISFASITELKTGIELLNNCPPLPGVTPPTI